MADRLTIGLAAAELGWGCFVLDMQYTTVQRSVAIMQGDLFGLHLDGACWFKVAAIVSSSQSVRLGMMETPHSRTPCGVLAWGSVVRRQTQSPVPLVRVCRAVIVGHN